jgi:hypothetical protein
MCFVRIQERTATFTLHNISRLILYNRGGKCLQRGTDCHVKHTRSVFNPLTPNDLHRRRTVSPLKIKIPRKNMREKPTNTPIIRSVYYVW